MSNFTSARLISTLALLAMLLTSACGFQPVHGRAERATMSTQLESLDIVTDASRPGQLLKAEIEDQVNPDFKRAEKRYTLHIALSEVEISLFINPDGTSSRGDLQFTSNYRLVRKSDGKLVDTGNLMRISSYNTSETADYAAYVSREDARKRGVVELAQDYKLRLANLLPKLNDPDAKPVTHVEPEAAPLLQSPTRLYENRPTGF